MLTALVYVSPSAATALPQYVQEGGALPVEEDFNLGAFAAVPPVPAPPAPPVHPIIVNGAAGAAAGAGANPLPQQLENINEFDEDDGLMIEFIPDEDFKDVLEKGLTAEQKARLDEIKKK